MFPSAGHSRAFNECFANHCFSGTLPKDGGSTVSSNTFQEGADILVILVSSDD